MKDYHQGLLAIVLLVAIVALSTGPTGMYTIRRGYIDIPTRSPLSQGLAAAEDIAPGIANYCTEAMRYQGRQYEEYLTCCSDQCYSPCLNATSEYEVKNCVGMCGRICRDIMTNNYLDLEPGTWR